MIFVLLINYSLYFIKMCYLLLLREFRNEFYTTQLYENQYYEEELKQIQHKYYIRVKKKYLIELKNKYYLINLIREQLNIIIL
jgi:hypothetical protein